jgi:hypothetical protein
MVVAVVVAVAAARATRAKRVTTTRTTRKARMVSIRRRVGGYVSQNQGVVIGEAGPTL